MPTDLNNLFTEVSKLPKTLENLRDDLAALRQDIEALTGQLEKRFYDVHDLRRRGYSRDRAYQLLRAHGTRITGRLRIDAATLQRVEADHS